MKREVALQIPLMERLRLRELTRKEHNRLIRLKLRKNEAASARALEVAMLKGLYETLAPGDGEL